MKNEIRKDYLVDRWVIFAPQRAKRPTDYAIARSKAKVKICPFCPGNENLTPPAKLLYVLQGGKILKLRDSGRKRRSDWAVRCIPNLYPALSSSPSGSAPDRTQGDFPYYKRPAIGAHEILIESPTHEDHPHRASQQQTELWIQAAIDRLRDLSSVRATKSMALFRNHGREAGASLAHAHSQMVTTSVVPTRIEQERLAMKKFHDLTGSCALCRIRATESRSERKIWNTEDFTVFAPWASIYPFEFWVVPKRHNGTFLGLSQDEVTSLAETIRLSFGALAHLLSDPPYNSVFHLTSSNRAGSDFHWHLEVYPKLSIHAGLELGTGMYINTLKPEAAAEELAKAVEKEAANLE